MRGVLSLEGIRLDVRLGVGPEERAWPQAVELCLAIRFASLPEACRTDRIEDTVCYARLVEVARDLCDGREFRLIERLAAELHARLRAELPEGAGLWIEVTKLAPPLEGVQGGARFALGDDPAACGSPQVRARRRARHGRVRR